MDPDGATVSGRLVFRSMSMSHTSARPSRVEKNEIWRPSGETDGSRFCSALLLARLVFEPAGQRLGLWALAGLMAGLALLSKYHGVLLILGIGLFLASTREGRRWLVTKDRQLVPA